MAEVPVRVIRVEMQPGSKSSRQWWMWSPFLLTPDGVARVVKMTKSKKDVLKAFSARLHHAGKLELGRDRIRLTSYTGCSRPSEAAMTIADDVYRFHAHGQEEVPPDHVQ